MHIDPLRIFLLLTAVILLALLLVRRAVTIAPPATSLAWELVSAPAVFLQKMNTYGPALLTVTVARWEKNKQGVAVPILCMTFFGLKMPRIGVKMEYRYDSSYVMIPGDEDRIRRLIRNITWSERQGPKAGDLKAKGYIKNPLARVTEHLEDRKTNA